MEEYIKLVDKTQIELSKVEDLQSIDGIMYITTEEYLHTIPINHILYIKCLKKENG